jgi:hypothetical protein
MKCTGELHLSQIIAICKLKYGVFQRHVAQAQQIVDRIKLSRQKNARCLKAGTTQEWDQTEIGRCAAYGTPLCIQAYRLHVVQMNEV